MLVITFETNKRNKNVVHISNEKDIYYPPKTQNRFVCSILFQLERLAQNPFSACQNGFLEHHQNLLQQITRIFPIGFYLLFSSSK
jgi:hypothetical protein